jgi:hypothetical protein
MIIKLLFNKATLNSSLILIIFNLSNFINLITQIILSSALDLYYFSLYYSLVGIMSFIIIPILNYGLILQKKFYELQKKIKNTSSFFWQSNKNVIYLFILIFLLGITFLNQLKDLLRYENNFAYIIFFFISFISAIIVIPNSLNNSLGFFKLNNSINLGVDIFKLVLILLLSNFYQFDFNILINVHLALLIILYFVYLNFSKKYIYISRSQNIKIDLSHSEKTNLMYTILYSFFIPFFYFFDIILVRNLFSAEVSSNYIVASSISKIIYIFPQALNVVIFNESLKLSMFKVLSILIFFIIIIISIMTILFFMGEYVIEVIYSSKFNEAYKFLKFLLPSFFLTSLNKILCDILISKKKFKFIFGLYLSFLLFIFLTYINSKTALNISLNLLFANIFFFLIVSFYIYKDYFKILKNFFKVLKNYTKTI